MIKRVYEALKQYFIPNFGNDNKPHILRPNVIAFVLLFVFIAESAFIFSSLYITPRSKLFGIIEANALIDETNQQRTANGVAMLQESSLLDAAAQDKANDMVANGYFAHTSPAGVTPWDWFNTVGYQYSFAGENLAVNFSDSQDVTNAWMNSPEHRANILNNNFTQIGMATAQGTLDGKPAIFVVEEFGTPANAPVAFVNSAAAASVPTAPTKPATVTPTVKPVATTKPTTKPKPVKTTAAAPVVIASTSVAGSSSQQIYVEVQGIVPANNRATTSVAVPVRTSAGNGIETIPAATTSRPGASAASAGTTSVSPAQPSSLKAAIVKLASDPKAFANDFYILLMLLFIVASILNIFIKIRTQYPHLILGGMIVIVLSGLCVMLNQNIGFLHAAIF